jgi:hypothetical protein
VRRIAALLALAATPAGAQTVSTARCLNDAEAQSVVLVAMPAILRDAGRVCAALPASSLLRRAPGPFIAKYDAEADRAWPAARSAIAKFVDPSASILLGSDYARPLLTSIVAPQITGRIQPDDCQPLDRVMTQIEPLPPRNAAILVVTTLQFMKAQRAKGAMRDVPDLPLCATEGRR